MDDPPPPYCRLEEEDLPFNHVDAAPDIELQPAYGIPPPESHVRICQPSRPIANRLVCQPSITKPPNNYECVSIVSILFCMPMAVVAIIFAHHSSMAADGGDIEEARRKGILARNTSIAAILLGIIIVVVTAIFHDDIYKLYQTI